MKKAKKQLRRRILNKFGRKVSSRKIRGSIKHSNLKRKSPWRSRKMLPEIRVIAPSAIDFYKPKRFEKTNAFINELQQQIRSAYHNGKPHIRICFRNTHLITAAAAINLFAETSRTLKRCPGLSFSVTPPPTTLVNGQRKTPLPVVETVLNRLGFYELLGLPKRKMRELPNVSCWHQTSGFEVDGQLAASILNKVQDTGIQSSLLYRSGIEAVANAVEHAYSEQIMSDADISLKTWWMFVAILDGKLVLLVCDLGHGIPNTLEKTQAPAVLEAIWKLLGTKATYDCQLIQASTLVKQTRTRLNNRGKGGKDLTSLVDKYPGSQLVIISNKGLYRYKDTSNIRKMFGTGYDHKSAINGTIIEWSIKL
ncbi:TPA: hypothetical protein ACGVB5_002513 [Vibrio vulnificus]|nr:hypothetical protein [Vibrio vulnificus]HAS6368357.1 hypothetical protein [Vibrio vulnificus]HDY7612161.1 hypothetical protein [Vibrio vulnificus]HDY8018857.1 hypothetical protein [Vibrio vulnificus]